MSTFVSLQERDNVDNHDSLHLITEKLQVIDERLYQQQETLNRINSQIQKFSQRECSTVRQAPTVSTSDRNETTHMNGINRTEGELEKV